MFSILIFLLASSSCTSFVPHPSPSPRTFRQELPLHSSSDDNDHLETAAKRAAWKAAEVAGNIVSSAVSSSLPPNSANAPEPPSDWESAIDQLREDYANEYFLSGKLSNAMLYTSDCTFADPFASFDGRDRFISNLANLALFVKEYKTKMIEFNVDKENHKVDVRILVKLILNLPWSPRLSWMWGVEHIFTSPPNFQIKSHRESWSVSPWEGISQCFRPGNDRPL